jgi:protein SCO1/2
VLVAILANLLKGIRRFVMRTGNSIWLAAISIAALVCVGHARASESSDDPHAAHKKMASAPTVRIEQVAYTVPDISLVDTSGQAVNLRELFAADKPLLVNFIFTTCTTICPVITATTLQMQRQLHDDAVQPNYVTISIDPDYDSSEILRSYANQYGADWTFLTGAPNDVLNTLKAFDAYNGNKVNHFALTLMRAANTEQWTRVVGLTSAQQLAEIWRDTLL